MTVSVWVASEFALAPTLEAHWLSQLPTERREHIGRWPDRLARQRSLLASRLLDRGLRLMGFPAPVLASLRYSRERGPTLDLPVRFSLSHCAGRIVCAISTRGPVGVDVEALGDLKAADFPSYLSEAERAWAGRSAARFYSVWTRKEAVVKAADTRGLPVLRQVDTMAGARRATFAGTRWRIAPVPVGRGHVAHLALADLRTRVRIERVRARSLEASGPPEGQSPA